MFDISRKVLQLNVMRQRSSRRGFFTPRGFTLLELLIVISLIGIIAALLIPNINQARTEAYRQVARQQAKTLEKALAAWFTAQSSLDAASAIWNLYADANGYLSLVKSATVGQPPNQRTCTFLTHPSGLGPYLPENTTSFTSSGLVITTPEMRMLPAPMVSGKAQFIGGSVSYNQATPTANLLLYWDSTKRSTVSPKVLLFLPEIQ